MATKDQQYEGRLYTQAEVDEMVRKADDRVISFATNPSGRAEIKVNHQYVCEFCGEVQYDITEGGKQSD